MAAERLYTPELLALAVSLANYPADPNLPFKGEARSQSCGSTLALGLGTDAEDRIAAIGMKVSACAIGQAAAAVFAAGAEGRSASEIEAAHDAIAAWLAGEGETPDWPGFTPLLPAREFPGRHGAMMLPWKAAGAALSTLPAER